MSPILTIYRSTHSGSSSAPKDTTWQVRFFKLILTRLVEEENIGTDTSSTECPDRVTLLAP